MPTTRIPYGVLDGRYINAMGDTMLGTLILSGAPTSDLHAATKKYVDDAVSVGGHTHTLSAGATDVTATATEVNLLDLSGLSVGQVLRATGAAAASWASIQAGDLPAGIDVTKLADGSVTNAEYQYLSGVTSSIQTQLNSKAADSDVLKKDGSVSLTADWDIGDGRKLKGDELAARDSAGLKLCDDGGSGIFIKDGGNVGIGTTNPGSSLTVVGDTNIGNGAMFFNSVNNRLGINTTSPQVSVDVNGWTGIPGNMSNYSHMSVAADLFIGNVGSGVGRLRMGSNANVGFMQWNSYYTSSYDSRSFDTSKPAFKLNLEGNTDRITFTRAPATTGAQSFSELMRIEGDGRVGIGTVSPSHILDIGNIASAASFNNVLRVTGHKYNEVATFATLRLQNGLYSASGQESYFAVNALREFSNAAVSARFRVYSGSTEKVPLTLLYNGDVGINTIAPERQLDVLDASDPQLRLTHTAGSVFTDLRTDGNGHLTIDPTGAEVNVDAILDFTKSMGNSTKNPTSDAPADWIEVKISGTTYYVPVYTAS